MTQGGLSKLLKELPKEVRLEVRPAVRDWGRDIRDRARSAAPTADAPISRAKGQVTSPGTLRRSISYGLFDKGLAGRAGIFGAGKAAAWYAHFVEFGTKPHFNSKGGGRKSFGASRGANMHPGTPEQPFLRPAARAAGRAGAAKVIAAIRSALDKASGNAAANTGTLAAADQQLQKIESYLQLLRSSELNKPPFSGGGQE